MSQNTDNPKPWTAQWVMDRDTAQALIGSQFPELAPVDALLIGTGWDNTVFRVNENLIFRFPRRRVAVPLLEAEARVLPAIAERLPLAIPLPTYLGKPDDRFPRPFLGYARVKGQTACSKGLRVNQRAALAEPLARFLAALHQIEGAEASHLGAGPDTLRRMDYAIRLPRCLDNLDKIQAWRLLDNTETLKKQLKQSARAAPRQDAPEVLAHGDLYVRHLMLDEAGRLTGVIDWGDLHRGDPAVDLSIAHSVLPTEAHARFRAAYGAISEATWLRARFRAIYSSVTITVYGYEINDADLKREGLYGLRTIAAA